MPRRDFGGRGRMIAGVLRACVPVEIEGARVLPGPRSVGALGAAPLAAEA